MPTSRFRPSTAQTTHTVTQSGTTFVPANIVIDVGDIVEWVWTAGTHTVTEGPGPFPTGLEALTLAKNVRRTLKLLRRKNALTPDLEDMLATAEHEPGQAG